MKKRLSVLLSIIIVLSICAPLTSVMAEEARKQSVLKQAKKLPHCAVNMTITMN